MVTIDALKLNKFKPVRLPKNSTYFARFGEYNPDSSHFSGEDDDTPLVQSKLDAIRQMDDEYRDFIPKEE